jgi:hypothetical protein
MGGPRTGDCRTNRPGSRPRHRKREYQQSERMDGMNIYAVISLGILVVFPLFFHFDYFFLGFRLKQLKSRLLPFRRGKSRQTGNLLNLKRRVPTKTAENPGWVSSAEIARFL